MRVDFIERLLSRAFALYARHLVSLPWAFIIVPVIVTVSLGTGLVRQSQAFVKDELSLYIPTDAVARQELKQLDSLFHINDSDPFYAIRRYDIKRAGYIIVTGAVSDGDILNPSAIHAALKLWSIIQSLPVNDHHSHRLTYPSICVKLPIPVHLVGVLRAFLPSNTSIPEEICVSNPLVEMVKLMLVTERSMLNSSIGEVMLTQISDIISIDPDKITHLLGGVTLDSRKRITGAKAIMLPYALRHCSASEDWIAEKWELKLADFLIKYRSPTIRVSWWTYETLTAESARDREQLKKMLLPCFLVVSLYTILCCCVGSWVRSRPFLAIGGVLSAAMAILSAVGVLLLMGFRLTSVAYSMPFIIFSVGVDNVFILLSAWRATDISQSLERRMMATFSDAGVSITVTSMTDVISFAVGCMTPFPSVQMFCAYAVAAVIFTYIYQLTFFAGIMVLTSMREVQHRNCLTFMVVKHHDHPSRKIYPAGKTAHHPDLYQVGYSPKRVDRKGKFDRKGPSFKNHMLAEFFRTTYSNALLNPIIRAGIIIAFLAYIGVAIWGCVNVKVGLDPTDLLPDNSYGKRTLKMSEKYFSDFGTLLHVWMYNLSSTNFVHRRLWSVLDDEIQLYEHTEFTGLSDSWSAFLIVSQVLKYYMNMVDLAGSSGLRSFMSTVQQSDVELTPDNFVPLLRKVFLPQPQFAKYNRDIVFTSNGTVLDASRVTIQLKYVGASNHSRAMRLFRRLAETSELQTGVYADFFQFAEQYNAVLPGTLTSIAIAGGAVIIVSLLLIPETIASLWVALTILSINVGIIGFMTFWDVRLDFISMVTIVMSIGFCVDFASHLAYNFAKGSDLTGPQRMRNALYAVGTPIVQSATSTILGVSFMATAESYVFRSFLKTIILVITLGTLHGLVVLPVLLTLFYSQDQNDEPERVYTAKITSKIGQQKIGAVDAKEVSKTAGRDNVYSTVNCHNGQPIHNHISDYDDFGQYAVSESFFTSQVNPEFSSNPIPQQTIPDILDYSHPYIAKDYLTEQGCPPPIPPHHGYVQSMDPYDIHHNQSLFPG